MIEDDRCHGVFADFVDDTHAIPIRFIPNFRNAFQFLLVHKVPGLLKHVGFVDQIRDFGHNNALPAVISNLNRRSSPDHNPAPSGKQGIANSFVAIQQTPGRKIRGLDIGQKFIAGDITTVDIGMDAIDQFTQVVGSHVGGHTDGNTCTAVHQQMGKFARHDRGLLQ